MAKQQSTSAPPASEPNDLQRALRIIGKFAGFSLLAAAAVFILGEIIFGDSFAVWLTRLLALAVLAGGLMLLRYPVRVVFLQGKEDTWYALYSWDHHLIGFVPRGMARILPLQHTEKWREVHPVFVRHDVQARNRQYDMFTVHVRVSFDVLPDEVYGADARWLYEQYPDGLEVMVKQKIGDVVSAELRNVDSFSRTIEAETETALCETLNRAFEFLSNKGIDIRPQATLVDIIIPDEILKQRMKIRAEYSTLQIIREVAHDMGMSTDELLMQRVLENLPRVPSNRLSQRDIIAAVQAFGAERGVLSGQPLPHRLASPPEAAYIEDKDFVPDDQEAPGSRSFIEGRYEPIDENDPDSDGSPRGYVSPF